MPKMKKRFSGREGAISSPKCREKLIETHLDRIKTTIGKTLTECGFNHLEKEGFLAATCIAFLRAADRYDINASTARFWDYAKHRVRGAVIDELRRMMPGSEYAHKIRKKIKAVIQEIEARGDEATELAVAESLGVNLDELRRMSLASKKIKRVEYNEVRSKVAIGEFHLEWAGYHVDSNESEMEGAWQTEEQMISREFFDTIDRLMRSLSQDQALVLGLIYFEEMTLAEVAAVMGYSEERAGAIHRTAVRRIASTIAQNEGEYARAEGF